MRDKPRIANLFGVLQQAEQQSAQCALTLVNTTEDEVCLHVVGGRVQYAVFGDLSGADALERILGLPDPMVEITALGRSIANLESRSLLEARRAAQVRSDARSAQLERLQALVPGAFTSLTLIEGHLPCKAWPESSFFLVWDFAKKIGARIKASHNEDLMLLTGRLQLRASQNGSKLMLAWEDEGAWVLGALTAPRYEMPVRLKLMR